MQETNTLLRKDTVYPHNNKEARRRGIRNRHRETSPRASSVNLTKTFPDVFSPGGIPRGKLCDGRQQPVFPVCRESYCRPCRSHIVSHKVAEYRIPLLCDKKRRSRTLSGFRYIGYDGNLKCLHCEHGSALVLIGHKRSLPRVRCLLLTHQIEHSMNCSLWRY